MPTNSRKIQENGFDKKNNLQLQKQKHVFAAIQKMPKICLNTNLSTYNSWNEMVVHSIQMVLSSLVSQTNFNLFFSNSQVRGRFYEKIIYRMFRKNCAFPKPLQAISRLHMAARDLPNVVGVYSHSY